MSTLTNVYVNQCQRKSVSPKCRLTNLTIKLQSTFLYQMTAKIKYGEYHEKEKIIKLKKLIFIRQKFKDA